MGISTQLYLMGGDKYKVKEHREMVRVRGLDKISERVRESHKNWGFWQKKAIYFSHQLKIPDTDRKD